MSTLPTRSGYAEVGGEWSPRTGLVGYGEVGYRPQERWTLFGRGEWARGEPRVLGGIRYVF